MVNDPDRRVAMSDPFRRFVCRACGYTHTAWAARCSKCLSLEGIVAVTEPSLVSSPAPPVITVPRLVDPVIVVPEPPTDIMRARLTIARAPSLDLEDPATELVDMEDDLIPLSDVPAATFIRDSTGLAPLDHVLGGGLVEGSVVLLASPPGIGKSSLTLQMLNGLGHRCLYVTGEETRDQIAATARRIGVASKKVYPLAERHLHKIFAKARAIRAQTIAIDSIQKMYCEDVGGRPGSATQLKECTARLVEYAKETATALWLIGHVTNDGDIAGPRTIEHDVDVVLELDQGTKFEGNERILRCAGKNRFGPTNVAGHFELTAEGFVGVDMDGWNETL